MIRAKEVIVIFENEESDIVQQVRMRVKIFRD